MNIFSAKYFFLFVVALQCCLWFVVKNDPFFGDAIASTSQAANHIFNQNLSTVFYPLDADPGHPTLYAYVLAIVWKIVGRTLWVSHAYSCAWALFLVYAFRMVAMQILSHADVNRATLLVLLFPTYLAQSAMMLNTVALMSFFLLAIYAVYTNNRIIICLASVCMCATHLQAPFLLLSLACFDAYRNVYLLKHYRLFKWVQNRIFVYIIPVGIFTLWLFVHYRYAGWLLVSPQYNDVKELNTITEYVKAIALICWRLVDYGMLSIYGVLIYVFLKHKQFRKEGIQLFCLVIPCCMAMAIFLNNTIGHRYFMALGMLAIVFVIYSFRELKPDSQKALYVMLGVSLLAGNFLYYPGKTLGDATLAYRNFFDINKRIHQEHSEVIFYSHAPIANPATLTYLQMQGIQCQRINEKDLEAIPAIIQSNINAEFTQTEVDYLAQHWFGKSYESGAVYATVFFNPKFYVQKEPSKYRQPSSVERWMVNVKAKLK